MKNSNQMTKPKLAQMKGKYKNKLKLENLFIDMPEGGMK